MLFDRESTVVISKLNHLNETSLTNYCQKFGNVQRCLIKTSSHSRHKEPYALVKFSDPSSVTSILVNPHHNIDGTHVHIRIFQLDTRSHSALPNVINLPQQNSSSHQDPILQENIRLKYEIGNLQKSLAEAQIYSKTAYETFQALREKFEAEQLATSKMKLEHAAVVDAYEQRLKQLSSTSSNVPEKEKVKDEPMDSESHHTNQLLERQIISDRLEQAQIDLGKCQTENAILHAKLSSREQQFELRYKELNGQYNRLKKQYDHVSSCIKDFYSKLYPKKRVKTDRTEETNHVKTEEKTHETSHDSSDDIVEIVMQVEPAAASHT